MLRLTEPENPLIWQKHGLDTRRKPFWYDENMLEGKCPKCKTSYFGWALRFPRHQVCPRCGVGLEILEDGRRVSQGYSPFAAKKHSVVLPTNASPTDDKMKETRVPKE
jgi:hypothetical protein